MACPYCESASGLTILGSRAASLTSVALSQLYTSPFNREKQALAFSDNVQDASRCFGFFAALTFRVNLRTAIRRVIAGHIEAQKTHYHPYCQSVRRDQRKRETGWTIVQN